jgi:hypothetical protein
MTVFARLAPIKRASRKSSRRHCASRFDFPTHF